VYLLVSMGRWWCSRVAGAFLPSCFVSRELWGVRCREGVRHGVGAVRRVMAWGRREQGGSRVLLEDGVRA